MDHSEFGMPGSVSAPLGFGWMVEYDEEDSEYDGPDFEGPEIPRPRRWRTLLVAVALIVVVVLIASLVFTAGQRPHPVPVPPPYRV